MRRPGRPDSCTLHADADVCLACPHAIPPCAGIGARSLCPSIAAEAVALRRLGKARGDLAQVLGAIASACPPSPPRALRPPIAEGSWIATERLVADCRVLAGALPPAVDLVVAIPRSGLLPGSLLAMALHVPLLTVSQYSKLVDPGHGHRLTDLGGRGRHVLLVDDTIASGKEMAANLGLVRAAHPDALVTRAAVYAHPHGLRKGAVDLYVHELPGCHLLEWNFFNTGHSVRVGLDFDGILCPDFSPEQCRDDASYRAAMAAMPPLHLPRRRPVPLIVTARPESTRAVTLAWLDRHRVAVDRLVMRDFVTDPGRDWNDQIGEWKAGHYEASRCTYFVESDPRQARVIHLATGRPVLCPAIGRSLGLWS